MVFLLADKYIKVLSFVLRIYFSESFELWLHRRGGTFVWTDCEAEMLSIVTVSIEYKVSKSVESVDWESCQTKYSDLLDLYKQQYPSTEEEITKASLTTKLKATRH